MADNITLNPGTGGAVTRSEDVAGIHLPVIKVHIGAAGVDGGPVTADNPLSVRPEQTNKISALNSIIGTLAASATWTGTYELIEHFVSLDLGVAGAPSVAPGTLRFEFSQDGVTTDVGPVPYTLTGPNSLIIQQLRVVYPYFRASYVNGGTALTSFRLMTFLHRTAPDVLTRFLNQTLDNNEPIKNVRGVLAALGPIAGVYDNITNTPSENSRVCLDVAPNVPGIPGFVRGQVATSATSEVAVRATTYTEQTSGAQRSVSSTSAADLAVTGTGARTVRLTYYTLTAGVVAGPFTEDVALAGVVGVNTVATNICYVESIEVLTAGSGGVNAGIIQLWTGLVGTGSVFASIAASARKTLYGHHYVPSGKTCYVTDVVISSNLSTGNVAAFGARTQDLVAANAAERIFLDALDVQGSTSANVIQYATPRRITGPTRITFYVVPTAATSTTQKLVASFYEL